MAFGRELDWDLATVEPGRICVPLGGGADDNWLDHFQAARLQAKQTRTRENLPHLQIELRDGEIVATGIRDGEHDAAKRLLIAIVHAANQAGRGGRSRSSAFG